MSTLGVHARHERPDGTFVNGFGMPLNENFHRDILINGAALFEAGALFAFGTDNPPPLTYAKALQAEIDMLGQILDPTDVIRVLTINSARFLGLDEDLGTIEAGKIADLVIVEGNPLQDLAALSDIDKVIQSGRITVE